MAITSPAQVPPKIALAASGNGRCSAIAMPPPIAAMALPAADVERNVVCGLDGSTSSTEKTGLWPVLMKCSTYRTQPTAIAALPTHAVIQ